MCDTYELLCDPNHKVGWVIVKDIEKKIVGWFKDTLNIDVEVDIRSIGNRDGVEVSVATTEKPIKISTFNSATFSLSAMPGCCGILISHNTRVSSRWQGKGIAKFFQSIKEDIAKQNNYSYLMCTVTSDNVIEKHILETNGWFKKDTFVNRRTRHSVEVWTKVIE